MAAAGSGSTGHLVRLWQEVLGGESIGLDVNFFELGANSIHMVQVQRRIGELFGREIPVLELFERPTIRLLAELLDEPDPAAAGNPSVPAASAPHPAPAPTPQPSTAEAAPTRAQHHERRRSARRAGGSGRGTTA